MIGGSGPGVGGTHTHCSLSDFGRQEWRVGSPSQEPLSKPEAAWKPFGLVGSHEFQPLWQQHVRANRSQAQQHSVTTILCKTHYFVGNSILWCVSENYIRELLFQYMSVTGNCKFVFCYEELLCDLLHPDMTGSGMRGLTNETADSLVHRLPTAI